jgi:hypothetical protein
MRRSEAIAQYAKNGKNKPAAGESPKSFTKN